MSESEPRTKFLLQVSQQALVEPNHFLVSIYLKLSQMAVLVVKEGSKNYFTLLFALLNPIGILLTRV